MLRAYLYREEREIDKIAAAVAKAWGAEETGREERREYRTEHKTERTGRITSAEEFDAFALTPLGRSLGFDKAKSHPIEKPKTAPGVDPKADKEYLRRLTKKFDEIEAEKKARSEIRKEKKK